MLLAGAMSVGTLSAQEAKQQTQKPNIILLLADDLGYGDLSCFGSRRINTPNIDNMAQEGVKFTQFYAGSAVSTPTRVSIITGQYPLRYSVSTHFNDQEMFLQPNAQSMPKVLQTQGYRTKHVGKWHLGGLNEAHVKDRVNSMPGPIDHGFDEYLAMLEDPLYRKPAMLEDRLYKDGAKHLVRNDKIIEPINKHWTEVKTDDAIDFIEKASKKGQPFYLNLWFDTPHAPYERSADEVMAPYENKARGVDLLYRGMVANLDKSVGRVLNKLKQLGIDKNTIVILTSDNGPAYQGSPGMYKGRKRDFHEGGIRVPMIAWWPGKIKSGAETDVIGHTCDFFPTFTGLAGQKDYSQFKLDGKDLTYFLLGKTDQVKRGTMFWEISQGHRNGNYGVTTDTRPEPLANQVARNGNWKLLAYKGKPTALYNLEDDPYERWNMINSYPKIAKQLHNELLEFLAEPREKKPY
jgi:N-acetylgalactosamine-6-sulfatase